MIIKSIAIYVFLDDLLKSMNYKESATRCTSYSKIATVILISARYFGGNIEKSISFVRGTGLMPDMLSKSRFNRRMHGAGELFADLFFHTGRIVKRLSISDTYIQHRQFSRRRLS